MLQPTDRREFLKKMGYCMAYSAWLPATSWKNALGGIFLAPPGSSISSPILNAKSGEWTSLDFNGDEIGRPHDLLWNIPGYLASKGGIPQPSENAEVVIIGGGLSGLIAAYYLRDLRPVILEQASQLGGNSKGERLGENLYSIGAAYIVTPDPGSEIEKFLKEIDLLRFGRIESSEEMKIELAGALRNGFWNGETDPAHRDLFLKVEAELKRVLKEAYPEIPFIDSGSKLSREEFARLDRMSFEQWLQERIGPVPPQLLEYFQLYGWSSFNASIDELSAAQMLNFLASETESVTAFPGGNSAITASLYERLRRENGESSLRTGCIALDVSPSGDGVTVCYENERKELKTIRAKKCIIASPKFVAKRIIPSISAEQERAISSIRYRGYLVGNIFVQGRIEPPAFDIYRLRGMVPPPPMAMKPGDRSATDFCFADWSGRRSSSVSVLTLFRPLPYDGARQFLFNPGSHDKHQAFFRADALEILRELGVGQERLLGTRLTRWGHSMPVAEKGLISSGRLAQASQPIGGRIFFANQDNWANPAFECAFEVARETALAVRGV